MFVAVNVNKSGKRKIKKGRTVGAVREYFLGGGEKFYIVEVFDSQVGVNWDEVAAFIGRHGKHTLLSRSISLPEESPVLRFSAERFRNILIFNTIEIMLKQISLAGCRYRCIINDPDGLYVCHLPKVARFAANVIVLTDKKHLYFHQVADIYSHSGASVSITQRFNDTQDDDIIIDTVSTFDDSSGILFSCEKNGISPKYTDGFNELKAICPPFIDTLDFLGAVYEFNRDDRLESSVCRVMCRKNESFAVSELTQMLIDRKIGDSGRLFFTENLT